MRRNYARRRDANDGELATVAEEEGAVMIFVGEPMDYLVILDGYWFVAEIKNLEGRAYGRNAQLTEQQKELMAVAKEKGATFWVWYSADDVRRDLRSARDAIRRGVRPATAVALRTTAAA